VKGLKMSEIIKSRVMLVDDYDMTRALLKIILRNEYFEVVGEAGDGEAALKMVGKLKPDIILLDVVMPKLNGLQTLSKLKQIGFPGMIFMVTNEAEQDIVGQAIKLGANGYIAKPFNANSILETLMKANENFVVRSSATVKPR
jgi:DNA-binding NarL/FixJ family response regulator